MSCAEQLRQYDVFQSEEALYADVQADDHGDGQDDGILRFKEKHHGNGVDSRSQGEDHVHLAAAELIAEPADKGDGEEGNAGRKDVGFRRDGLFHGEDRDDKAGQVGLHEAAVAGLAEAQGQGDDKALLAFFRLLFDRNVAGKLFFPFRFQQFLLFRHDRAFVNEHPDQYGGDHDDEGSVEGDSPAPEQDFFLGEHRQDDGPNEVGQESTRRGAEADETADEAAGLRFAEFRNHDAGAADFRACP